MTPPPLPPGISRIFKRGFRLPSFGNSEWFWYLKTNYESEYQLSYENTVEFYYNSVV